MDRLHGILPGWEIPKIRPESLASGPGLVRDYLGEVLLALRGDGVFLEHLRAHYPVGPSGEATLRDQNAVHK
ncbi:BREX system Lon protease-like protein BrxL, partial [Escherichia coli]|uniref:BREX system Lon protease-like protein BrxL n=1 Tax=Escherichia coli TaxID=562 RepID=UPI0038558C64